MITHTYKSKLLLALALLLALSGCGRCGSDDPASSPSGAAPGTEQSQEAEGASGAGEGSAEVRADALAIVNNRPVMLKEELDSHIEFLVNRYEALPDRPPTSVNWRNQRRRVAVQEAVYQRLIELEVERQGIEISDEQVAESLRDELGSLYDDERLFQQYLDARELEREAFLAERRQRLAETVLLESRGTLEPAEEEIQEYYRNNINRWEEGERALVSNIAVRFRRDADPELVERTRERLVELRQRIVDGLDFAEAAAEHGQTSDRRRGGDLGWIVRNRRSQLIHDGLEELIFAEPVGTITEPIRTSIGFQILWIRDRRPAGLRQFDEVENIITEPLRRQQRLRVRTELLRDLEDASDVIWFEDRWGLESEAAAGDDEASAEDD